MQRGKPLFKKGGSKLKKEGKNESHSAEDKLHHQVQEEHLSEGEDETDTQVGCAISSFLLIICIITLLVILFAVALIYKGV